MHKCIPTSVFIFVILLFVGVAYYVIVDKHDDDNNSSNQTMGVDNNSEDSSIGYGSGDWIDIDNVTPTSEGEAQSTINPTLTSGSGDTSDDGSGDDNVEDDKYETTSTRSRIITTIEPDASPSPQSKMNWNVMNRPGDTSDDGSEDDNSEDKYESSSTSNAIISTTIGPVVPPINVDRELVVSVYYETMCYYCQKWMKNHLCPVVEKLSEYFYVDFVPYGNAKTESNWRTGEAIISCQHGAEECEGNRIQSCAAISLPYSQSTKFICCMESENEFEPQGKRCAEKLGIDISSIIDCANGTDSHNYHYLNGLLTEGLDPPHTGVPWIIFNDKFQDDEEMNTARNDFISVLCKYIPAPKPVECLVDDDAQSTINPILMSGSGDTSDDGSGDDNVEDDKYESSSTHSAIISTTIGLDASPINVDRESVKVSVYYQTMSYLGQLWMKNHLCPVVEKLSEYFYVDFVPYGNAQTEYDIRTGEPIISCQYGAEECEGNRIQSCALKLLPYLQSTKFICCMESESEFEPQTKRCAEKLGINISSIIDCANGADGHNYHYFNGLKTEALDPPKIYVPWIIFNDEYQDDDEMTVSSFNFISVLCKYIPAPKPIECSVDDDSVGDEYQDKGEDEDESGSGS